jgi:hypothetical protein
MAWFQPLIEPIKSFPGFKLFSLNISLCRYNADYEGEYDTNAKRLIEMRKRLEAAN